MGTLNIDRYHAAMGDASFKDVTRLHNERLSDAEGSELQATIAKHLERDTEPHLLQYLISELNQPMEDGTQLNDEEKGEVFFVVKTVIESLKDYSNGRIIEP